MQGTVIDFELTEEQKDAVRLARDFADNELRPVSDECDREAEFPDDLLRKTAEAGFLSATIPEEYGGSGLEPITCAMVFEELFRGCAGLATSIGINTLATEPLLLGGTEEQKKRWLPKVCVPEGGRAAFCLTEPEAGSDVASVGTTATDMGDHYLINGQKCFIGNGGIADVYTVFATTDKSRGIGGITGFVVDGAADGLSMGKKEDKMGIRAAHTAEVFFDNVAVPKEDVLGEPGKAFYLVMQTLDQTRAGVAAGAVGIARAAFEEALDYAKQRTQFGQPIIMNQGISFKLADMLMKIEAGRRLYYYAAWLATEGKPVSTASAAAKAFCSDMCLEVTAEAIQVFGGYGYMKDYPLEKFMRDAKVMQIFEGTNEIQRVVLAANMMGMKDLSQF